MKHPTGSKTKNRIERRSSMCPTCGPTERAMARRVSIDQRMRTVSYQCPVCGSQWDVASPDQGVAGSAD